MARIPFAVLIALLFSAYGDVSKCWADPVDVVPSQIQGDSASLNGEWAFKYVAGLEGGEDEKFIQPSYNIGSWKKIEVPGHWELQGFAQPRYEDDVAPGLGLYRRTFKVQPGWKGMRVYLRFEGVLYGYQVYINGKPVGEWASGFNQATFDVTDFLAADGAENVLSVRVTTRSRGWEFDTMDCWALAGIYRDVTLFAVPTLHFKDYTTQTQLRSDGSAELQVGIQAEGPARATGRLLSKEGVVAGQFDVTTDSRGFGTAQILVPRAKLWTAETPNLYTLELALWSDGKIVERTQSRIGLREVSIEGGVLKLNGRAIKLRGVDHHEMWPERGRVSTDENTRKDLELIKAANINFVRTSHYPPHPRLLDLCDELGIYILDEVPFIHGREHLKDPAFQDVLLTRAKATVTRDRNHASVLFWSLGNENPINELGNATATYVKTLDPTRPIMFPTIGSYFAENYRRMSDVQDIYAPHYPTLKRARQFAESLTRPIIFTEYAHERGLSRAGTGVQDLWELFYQSPRIAGGAIWLFQDQGILRRAERFEDVKDGDLMVWLDQHYYYDTHGFFAMDGIVYSDRTPQLDYWLVRKVYSPVQVKEREIEHATDPVILHVENRYDFRSLSGFEMHWSLNKNGVAIQTGTCPLTAGSKQIEAVAVPLRIPAKTGTDVFSLALRCVDEAGHQLYERSLRVQTTATSGARLSALLAAQAPAAPQLTVSPASIIVVAEHYRLELDRTTGRLSLLARDGSVLFSGMGPHTGRHPTINDIGKARERVPQLWEGSLLTQILDLKTDTRTGADGIEISVAGRYPRPGNPEQSVSGNYRLLVRRDGSIQVSYQYIPDHASGEMLEAGLAIAAPASQSEFRWLGQGPYAGYPGKDRQNEYGLFHLNREDLYFPGNRREVELGAFTRPSGEGFLIAGGQMTLDLENKNEGTILSHVALVPGEGASQTTAETVDLSSRLNASAIKSISGHFVLYPLSKSWPSPLVKWFGQPGESAPIVKPFLRSYDQ